MAGPHRLRYAETCAGNEETSSAADLPAFRVWCSPGPPDCVRPVAGPPTNTLSSGLFGQSTRTLASSLGRRGRGWVQPAISSRRTALYSTGYRRECATDSRKALFRHRSNARWVSLAGNGRGPAAFRRRESYSLAATTRIPYLLGDYRQLVSWDGWNAVDRHRSRPRQLERSDVDSLQRVKRAQNLPPSRRQSTFNVDVDVHPRDRQVQPLCDLAPASSVLR